MGVHALALLALSVFAGNPAEASPSPAAKFRREGEKNKRERQLQASSPRGSDGGYGGAEAP